MLRMSLHYLGVDAKTRAAHRGGPGGPPRPHRPRRPLLPVRPPREHARRRAPRDGAPRAHRAHGAGGEERRLTRPSGGVVAARLRPEIAVRLPATARVTSEMNEKRGSDDIAPAFNEAIRLKNEGELVEAERILLGLRLERPERLSCTECSATCKRSWASTNAAASYRRSTELAPGSELASISLFHILYELRRFDGAMDELRRFRSRGPSAEYDDIIEDLKLHVPPDSLAEAASTMSRGTSAGRSDLTRSS